MMQRLLRFFLQIGIFLPILNFAQQWPELPTTISTPGVDASDSSVAVDPNGNSVAVWLENGIVMSSSQPEDGSWSTSLDTLSNAGSSDPQVVFDALNTVTAIWLENGVVKTSFKLFDGSWSATPVALSGSGASSPSIAIDYQGNAVAVWVENGLIKSSTQLNGGSWSVTPDTLSSAGADSPQVAVGLDGTVVAVWHAEDDVTSIDTIFSATKQIAGTWSAVQEISSASLNSVYPQVAVNSTGDAMAIWFTYSLTGSMYSNVVLQSASLPANGTWSSPLSVSDAGMINPAVLVSHVAFDGDGIGIAVWTTSYDGATFNCFSSVYQNGAWTMPTGLVLGNLTAYCIDAAIDFLGNAYAAWIFYDQYTSSIVLQGSVNALSSVGNLFWYVWNLSAGGNNAFLSIASNKSGTVPYGACTWTNYNGTNNVIQALTSSFPVVAPPTNLAVVQNARDFGVLSEYENVVSWDASTTLPLEGYRIFRDGIYLSNMSAGVSQYTDPNRNQDESTTYGVAAYDASGFQSIVAEVVFNGP